MRGVYPLIAEGNGGLAQSFPGILQIFREIPGQDHFSGRPTVVLFSVLDPLLAVVAQSTGHAPIVIVMTGEGSALLWFDGRVWFAHAATGNGCSCAPRISSHKIIAGSPNVSGMLAIRPTRFA